MRCETQAQPSAMPELTPEETAAWEQSSQQIDDALDLLEEFTVPYPAECLPALIF